MATHGIHVPPSTASPEDSVPLQSGVKARKSYSMRLLRKSSNYAPSVAFTPKQQNPESASGGTRRSRSSSPSSAKRKEIPRTFSLKKKYLRKVTISSMPQLPFNKGQRASASEAASQPTPSTFEEELAGQENQSPNDPEFLRRASERWRRRTGAVQLQPLHQWSQNGVAPQPTFQWPSSPSQQPAFPRRVSPRPVHYGESPFRSVPTSPILGASSLRRCNTQYSSLNNTNTESSLNRASHSYTSLSSLARSRMGLGTGEQSPSNSPKPRRPLVRSPKYVTPREPGAEGVLCGRLALDDTVAEELKKAANKELLFTNDLSVKTPLRRLSSRLRRSLRNYKSETNDSNVSSSNITTTPRSIRKNYEPSDVRRNKGVFNTNGSAGHFCCSDNTLMEVSSFTSLKSCQNFLSYSSVYSNACYSAPSSPSTIHRQVSSPRVPRRAMASNGLPLRVTFQDIFVEEPQIAEKFVCILKQFVLFRVLSHA